MKDIADKSDATAGASGELPAAEYNDHKNELQGAVERSGQTLSDVTLLQLAKALFVNGVAAQTCLDSGSANLIQLSPQTGANGLKVPDNYAELDGAILEFDKIAGNTSTSVSVNFGQTGTELSAKALVRTDGSLPEIGDVKGKCRIRWDNANDRWVLLENGSGTFIIKAAPLSTISPVFKNNSIIGDTTIGDALITLNAPLFVGQRVSITANGTGILEVTGGNGIYANNIFVTDGLCARATAEPDGAGGLVWQFVNEITASYPLSNDTIVQYSQGIMEIESIAPTAVSTSQATGNVFIAPAPYVILYSVVFSSIPAVSAGNGSTLITGWVGRLLATTSQCSCRAVGSSSSATVLFILKSRGKY